MAAAMYKFFIGKGYQLFSHQIQYKLYENCYILKPEFSQSQNADIYLLLITSTRTFFFMQTCKFWVFLFLIEFEFLEKKRLLGLEQVVVSK